MSITLKGIPFSKELIQEYGEFVDWKQMPRKYHKHLSSKTLGDHYSSACLTVEIQKVSTLRDIDLLRKYLEAGASPDGVPGTYNPPIFNCWYYCYQDAAKLLLDYGANVELIKRHDGETVLEALFWRLNPHGANRRVRQQKFIEMLLEHGNIKTEEQDKVALDFMKKYTLWPKKGIIEIKNYYEDLGDRRDGLYDDEEDWEFDWEFDDEPF